MNLNNPLTSIVRPVEDSYPYYQQPSWEWHHGEAIEIQPDKWPARAGLQFAGFWKMFKRKTDPQDPLTLQVMVWFASSQVNRIVQNHQEILANCLLWCPDATFGMISNVFFWDLCEIPALDNSDFTKNPQQPKNNTLCKQVSTASESNASSFSVQQQPNIAMYAP